MNIKRIYIWIKVIIDYVLSFPSIKGKILDSKNTIEHVKQEKKSLIRFGDGEFNILAGGNVHYQDYNINLQRELDEILKTYNASSKYLLCMPYRYFSKSNLVLNKRVLISCWSTPKRMFKKLVKKECIYGDAFVFAKDSRKRFEQIWIDYSNIILVHNDPQYLSEVCNFDKQRGYYIEVPKRNAYDAIEYIEMKIKDVYENNRLEKSQTIILLSAGPTAKVLTYHLSEQGYIAIDCGHVWDEPLEV